MAENSEQALFEAQAVLAFNLEPKEGVKYLKTKPLGELKWCDVPAGRENAHSLRQGTFVTACVGPPLPYMFFRNGPKPSHMQGGLCQHL